MDDERFDDVARSLSGGASRRRVIGGLLGILGLGAAVGGEAAAAKKKKVTVCVDGRTRRVSAKAWRRLRLSGAATKGKCPGPTTTGAPTSTTPDPKKCQKKHQACDGKGRRCCEYDPKTGERLRCDQGKKDPVCVAVGPGTTTTTGAPGTTTAPATTTTPRPPRPTTTTTTLPPPECVTGGGDSACATANPCRVGRCDPTDPGSDQRGCVFEALTGGSTTCGTGACERTVQRCVNGEEQRCEPGQPSAEVCNGIDDDCDGLVDEGAICPSGQRCENAGCCKVDGFGAEHACTSDGECCSGNCATHFFGTTCRPVGCLPSGTACGSNCPSACCSLTAGDGTCQ